MQAIYNNPRSISTVNKAPLFIQVSGAILFGLVMLFSVGFASADVAHNAAHDTRHSFAFPCH